MNNGILANIKLSAGFVNGLDKSIAAKQLLLNSPKALWGWKQKLVKACIWITILGVVLKTCKNPIATINKIKALLKMRNKYRNDHILQKYFYSSYKYYFNYNAPAWPSVTFNRYVNHLIKKTETSACTSLHTLVFAITKKCGFQCEHCCEWDVLNKPEQLSREDLLQIVKNFYQKGISQVQLSGGEPLNRFEDILFLLNHSPQNINFWIYTTGYNLSFEKARLLKENGLTGVTISLDHWDAEKHDSFRGKPGSFNRAINAIRYAVQNNLVVTLSICATRNFISKENLFCYAVLAKENRVTFIQILEPKAVGHYRGQDILLQKWHTDLLEQFYETINYNRDYKDYPIITYHGYYSRRAGCSGSGNDYLYVDTDGDVHNCPFCQRKIFSALKDNIDDELKKMKASGCSVFDSRKIKN